MQRKFHLAALSILSATAIGTAYAAASAENDALDIGSATITMTQAVTAAEQHVGGKAARAEYERHNKQLVFDVEVVKGNTVMDVKVDPNSGKVISATEDKADSDDEHDEAD